MASVTRFVRPVAAGLVLAVMVAAAAACRKAGEVATPLTGHLIDDRSGQPVAARVTLVDSAGRSVPIDGDHEHVDHAGRRWSYVDGRFTATLPPGGATIEIRRGLETRPLLQVLPRASDGRPADLTFRLRRWHDLKAAGFLSGDLHAHLPALDSAPLEMRAEDLNHLNLLVLGGLPEPNDGAFTGRVDRRSTPDAQIFLGQEVVDWHLGHLTLAGLGRLVPGYPNGCGTLEYWTSFPQCDVYRAGRAARTTGALVSVAHFENLPGAETPVAVALGLLDAIELPTWSDPMQLPAHLEPWAKSGLPTATFAPLRGVDYYYQFLNAGFRIPLAAGTDKSGDNIAIGSNRVYARSAGAQGFATWLAGVRAGTGFVTNGPVLDFEVEGHRAGETIDFNGARDVAVRVTARSILPFTTLEVVMNGNVVLHTLRLVQTNPPVDGVYTVQLAGTVQLDRSSWLAARAFADADITPRLLPRESAVFAHTSPVYFIQDGRPIREMVSVTYLRTAVQGLLNWLGGGPPFASEADRGAVEHDAREAWRVYTNMIAAGAAAATSDCGSKGTLK
jgi:hypothetical protein